MDYKDLSKEFLHTIYRYYKVRAQQQLNDAMHGESFALQYIAQNDGATVPSDIKTAMSVSSARIATVLNGLEDKGLITRRIDSNDRRRTILQLTPSGEKKAEESEQQLLSLATKMLEHLGEKDAKDCVRIMGRLADMCNDCK